MKREVGVLHRRRLANTWIDRIRSPFANSRVIADPGKDLQNMLKPLGEQIFENRIFAWNFNGKGEVYLYNGESGSLYLNPVIKGSAAHGSTV